MSEENTILEAVKERLSLDDEVITEQQAWFNRTISDTEDELKILMETTEIPKEYEFIVVGVVIKRYNRRKNEGMTDYTAGETRITYETDDFKQYDKIIQKYLNSIGTFSGVVDIW